MRESGGMTEPAREPAVASSLRVEMRVGKPHRLQFGGEQAAEVLLLFRRGTARRGRIGLGIDDDVAQEALGHAVLELKR